MNVKKDRKRFKDYFIPSQANDHQPYFLRLRVMATLLGVVFVIEGLFLAHTLLILPHSNYFAAIFASVLVDETNQSRQIEKLKNLTPNPILEKAALLKATDMATKGYFAHNSPDGKTPWYWFDQVGYDYAAAGENLAVNFTDSRDVSNAWLNSPAHRANILSANYTEIGIATANGIYKGKDAVFVVQEFGRPSVIARQVTTASSSESIVENLITEQKIKTSNSVEKRIVPIATTTSPTTTPTTNRVASLTGTTSNIAGASSNKLDTPIAPIDSPILEQGHPSYFDNFIASPRQASNAIYFILAAILTLALGLKIFIKIRVQYPHLITNAILLIAVLISLILLNEALGFTQAIV